MGKLGVLVSLLFLSIQGQAATVLKCSDRAGRKYKVIRSETEKGLARLDVSSGTTLLSTRIGNYEAAGVLTAFFMTISDQGEYFFLVGSSANLSGALTGYAKIDGHKVGVSCPLK